MRRHGAAALAVEREPARWVQEGKGGDTALDAPSIRLRTSGCGGHATLRLASCSGRGSRRHRHRDAKAAEQRFDRLGSGLNIERARRGYGQVQRCRDNEPAGGGFGRAQQENDGPPEKAWKGPSRPAFGPHLIMRAQPGHVDEHRHDALQRLAVRLDCRSSVHRRLLRLGAGSMGEVKGGVDKSVGMYAGGWREGWGCPRHPRARSASGADPGSMSEWWGIAVQAPPRAACAKQAWILWSPRRPSAFALRATAAARFAIG
jgi:hypothetical protein